MSNEQPKEKLKPAPESVEAIAKELRSIKGVENIVEFMKGLDDEYFGLKKEKLGLLEVLKPLPDDFNFLETFHDSPAAVKNREFSDLQSERYEQLREEREDSDDHFIDRILFKASPEIRKELLKSIDEILGGKD